MCEQCAVDPEEYGHPLPGWKLIKARLDGRLMKIGQWGLVKMNDPAFIWSDEPVIDRLEDLNEEAQKALPKEQFDKLELAFSEAAERFEQALTTDPRNGYLIYKAGLEVGYDPEKYGRFGWWLFDHIARHIKNLA